MLIFYNSYIICKEGTWRQSMKTRVVFTSTPQKSFRGVPSCCVLLFLFLAQMAYGLSMPGQGTRINKSGFERISAGGFHTTVLKSDGTLWAWGSNSVGELGDGTSGLGGDKSSPVQTR